MTVDEILATGKYTDRRGRGWDYVETVASWCSPEIDAEGVSWGYHYLSTAQMRLLIERDLHRDECKRAWWCKDHPVPFVYFAWSGVWAIAIGPGPIKHTFDTLPEAMDAARALAVGE